MDFVLRPRTVLLVIAGSRAYGMHTAESDIDLKGVCVPPKYHYLGGLRTFEQANQDDELQRFADLLTASEQRAGARSGLEGTVYELTKFCRLAADCNPNMLDVLFCRDADVRLCTDIGEQLREHRGLFLSLRAKYSFSGYAAGQLRRIKGHRKWLLDPPLNPPQRADFGLPPRSLIPADQLAAAENAVRKKMDGWSIDYSTVNPATAIALQEQIAGMLTDILSTSDAQWKCAARGIGFDENVVALLERERRYKSAQQHWRQFQQWKRSRNPSRAQLEAQFGFDTKHGAHLIRLLRMGREILTDGTVHVWRGDRDADELRAIRAGEWSFAELVEHAESIQQELDTLMASNASPLPARPDMAALESLVVSLVEQAVQLSGG